MTAGTTPDPFTAAPFIGAPAGIGAPSPNAGPAPGAPVTGPSGGHQAAGAWDFRCIATSIPSYVAAAVYMDEVFGLAQMYVSSVWHGVPRAIWVKVKLKHGRMCVTMCNDCPVKGQ